MEVIETAADGLTREFRVVVSSGELEEKMKGRLEELGRAVAVPGFRPGRVPLPILKRRFGASVSEEVRRHTIEEGITAAMSERKLRAALPPKVEIGSEKEGGDLEFTMSIELLPEIPETNFADLDVERLVAEVPEEEVDKAIARIAEQHRKSEPVARPAETGDLILADVEARIGEEEIPGAGGKDRQIELGSGSYVPGFEEGLLGAAAGETRKVEVSFPADYAVESLAGKEAVFSVAVKEVRRRLPAATDDTLAEEVGLGTLGELREEVRERMQRDWDALARQRLKRAVLDKLAARFDFPVPPGLVEIEFDSLWRQYETVRDARAKAARGEEGAEGAEGAEGEAMEAFPHSHGEGESVPHSHGEGESAPHTHQESASAVKSAEAEGSPEGVEDAGDDQGETEEERKASYRRLAERRVRLGLLLAEVGRNNNITVSQEELRQAVTREALRHPGHERQVMDFYRRNPEAVGSLQAPILEEKVIDFIVELAKVGERKVALKELLAEPEAEGAA